MPHPLFWRNDSLPRFLRARVFVSLIVLLVPALLGITMSSFDLHRGLRFLSVPIVPLAAFVPAVVFILWNRRRTCREASRAFNGVPLCWGCGYDLSATQSPGRCPECGDTFEAAHLKDKWKRMTFR